MPRLKPRKEPLFAGCSTRTRRKLSPTFVELAEGKREWTHPSTRKKSKDRLYDGTIFHRVIPDFMLQGGDPQGTGTGGPGYQFEDETKGSPHKFDKPGKLAMANAGPNTNGSQFFITVVPTTWLTGKHTIFGEVVEGQDVVEKITAVSPRSPRSTEQRRRAEEGDDRNGVRRIQFQAMLPAASVATEDVIKLLLMAAIGGGLLDQVDGVRDWVATGLGTHLLISHP